MKFSDSEYNLANIVKDAMQGKRCVMVRKAGHFFCFNERFGVVRFE